MAVDVLIVEDDVALARVIALMLRRQNISSEHVESSEDAIAALTARTYCVVVLDLLLGEFKSGYYVIDALRRFPVAERPYVMVVTGANMTAVANLDRGIVSAIFIKPVQLDVLATAVRAAVIARSGSTEEVIPSTKLTPETTRLLESLGDVKKGDHG